MLSDSAILKHIARQSKRQAGYKQLVRELGLHGEERRELNDHLQKLVKSGALIPVDSDRYALPQAAADKNLVAGRLTMHRDGFGFVIPDAKSLCAGTEIETRRATSSSPRTRSATLCTATWCWLTSTTCVPTAEPKAASCARCNRAHPTVVGIFHYGSREETTSRR